MGQEQEARNVKVLVGKPGLDGHDRGAKVVAHALREAGFDVVYTGLHQSVEAIVDRALAEQVDVIGLSIMSGAHLPICAKLVELCRDRGLHHMLLTVGGVIPHDDVAKLQKMGIHGVFPGGTPFEELVQWIQDQTSKEV